MGFGFGFDMFNIMFTIVFMIVMGAFIVTAVTGISQWNKNNNSPRLTIADYLMHGREAEFTYNSRECAITNHTNCWWFHDGVEQIEICEFLNLSWLVEKISGCVVDDKTVQDIFDNGLYADVCIL